MSLPCWNVHLPTFVSQACGMLLIVGDDGPGVARADRASLLNRGRRLDESTAGHGLGLAIAHDIVGFHEGSLALDRDPTLGGLRVRVELPELP